MVKTKPKLPKKPLVTLERSQNPLLNTKRFYKYCRDRFRNIGLYKEDFDLLLDFYKKRKLLLPINKVDSEDFYSTFQIHNIYLLEKWRSSCLIPLAERRYKGKTIKPSVLTWEETLKRIDQKTENEVKEFNQFLKFLIGIQEAYYPYAKSGSKTIQITGSIEEWQDNKRSLNLKSELKQLNLKIGDVAKWYKVFSDIAQELLGIKNGDWIQLWKAVSWRRKNALKGVTRLGVEYLQWAIMLKRVIEDYHKKEILDIDEISNISGSDILKFDPPKMKQYGILLRATRNKFYFDPKEKKNYYYDKYKRLFYLSNYFGLDYQPRVTVFVEGETEEVIFPKVFEWLYGKPENHGIDFINIQGINRFFGQKLSIKDPQNNKYKKILLSNFKHLVSYNLSQWQIIPFLVGDEEGEILDLLAQGEVFTFEANNYLFPPNWKFIWGIDNHNKPFLGKDLELANFSNEELATALTEFLGKKIKKREMKKLRNDGKGIKEIDKKVSAPKVKIEIAKTLFEKLFNDYEINKDDSIFERPIFIVINKIMKLANLNHMPVDRLSELRNKDIIRRNLSNQNKLKRFL